MRERTALYHRPASGVGWHIFTLLTISNFILYNNTTWSRLLQLFSCIFTILTPLEDDSGQRVLSIFPDQPTLFVYHQMYEASHVEFSKIMERDYYGVQIDSVHIPTVSFLTGRHFRQDFFLCVI